MADQSDPKLGCSCPAPGAAGCPEDPSRPDRPLSHHRVTVRDVAKNRLRIAPSKPSTERPWLTSNRCFVKSRKRKAPHRSKHRLLIFKECVRRRFITLPFGLGLPQSEYRTGGIPNETKPTHARHFGDVLHDPGARRFRFLGRGANVLYSNIGKPSSRSTYVRLEGMI